MIKANLSLEWYDLSNICLVLTPILCTKMAKFSRDADLVWHVETPPSPFSLDPLPYVIMLREIYRIFLNSCKFPVALPYKLRGLMYRGGLSIFYTRISQTGSRQPHRWGYQLIITARKWSLGQGHIFTPVCHSVHGGGVLPQCMLGCHPQTRHPLDQASPRTRYPPGPGTHPRCRACWEIRSTRGRYASYWNAILFGQLDR